MIGTFITNSGSIELSIHSDSDPDHLKVKHFRASVSSTTGKIHNFSTILTRKNGFTELIHF